MEQSRRKTQHCVENTNDARVSLDQISSDVDAINQVNTQIATATEEQNAAISEMRRNINDINSHVEETALGAKDTSMKSEYMTKLTGDIEQAIGQFKV